MRGKNQSRIFMQQTVHPFIFPFKMGLHRLIGCRVLYVFQFVVKEFFSGDEQVKIHMAMKISMVLSAFLLHLEVCDGSRLVFLVGVLLFSCS